MDLLRIVAIGGGDMGAGETMEIDQTIVQLTGKPNPRALFLPTASFDDRGYADLFRGIYGEALGCETDVRFLWDGYTREEIEDIIQQTKWQDEPHVWEFRGDLERVRQAIESADLIYVGGGNTKRMVELWRSIGVDQMLRDAAERGTVLAGLSAGCICWARHGNSDFALTEGLGKNTARVDGLGFLPFTLCPHTAREGFRLDEFSDMMKGTPGVGLGLDDGCAIQIVGDRYRIINSVEGAVAHKICPGEGGVTRTVLRPSPELAPLDELLAC